MYNNNYTDMYALPVFSRRKKGFADQPAKPLKKINYLLLNYLLNYFFDINTPSITCVTPLLETASVMVIFASFTYH